MTHPTATRTYPQRGTAEGQSQADTFDDLAARLATEIDAIGHADERDVPLCIADSDLEALKRAYGVLTRLAEDLRTG